MEKICCTGHAPIITAFETGDRYEIPNGITQKIFSRFSTYLDTLTNEKIFDCISRVGHRLRYPGLEARLDNETDSNGSDVFSLQLQKNNNGKINSSMKTTYAHVLVDSKLLNIPMLKTSTGMTPCSDCLNRVVNAFRKALSDSFHHSIHPLENSSKRKTGLTIILKKLEESNVNENVIVHVYN
jgi:hypothetical protein